MSKRSYRVNKSTAFKATIVLASSISAPSFGASFYLADISAQITVSYERISFPTDGEPIFGDVTVRAESSSVTTPASEVQQGDAIVNSSVDSARIVDGLGFDIGYSMNMLSSGSALPALPPGSAAGATFDSATNFIEINTVVDDTLSRPIQWIFRATYDYELLYDVDFGLNDPLNETSSASVDYLVTSGVGINETIISRGIIDFVSTDSILSQFSVDFGPGCTTNCSERTRLYVGSFGQATSVVPVPAAAWLFGSGLIGLIGIARRKKS